MKMEIEMNLNKKFYYKYIHLLYGHDTKFSKLLIRIITNPQNGFIVDEHLFITMYQNVYNELKSFGNVVYDDSGKNLYVRYYKHCHLMISHSSDKLSDILFTPRKVKQKIVYRYWGGLKINKGQGNSLLYKIQYKVKKSIISQAFSSFAAIGIANLIDIVDLSKVLKKETKYYYLSYVSNEYFDVISNLKRELDINPIYNEKKKVLLGHRGTKENNHIEILKMLDAYGSDAFEIYIPLSYGDQEYIQNVINYVNISGMKNVKIIKEFMEYPDYIKFLSTIDIAIFDGNTSYALGNLSILLLFNKTIYLNEHGVIAETMDKEGTRYNIISDIGKISVEHFLELMVYPSDFKSDLCVKSTQDRVSNWKRMFEDLDS